MRISDTMISALVGQTAARAQERLLASAQRAASGRAVPTPADDPVAAAKIVSLGRFLSGLDSMDRARQTVQFELGLADNAMARVTDVLGDAKALAVGVVDDTASADDRAAAAEVVRGQFQQLLNLANTRLEDGRYLFGGLRSDAAPYGDDGTYVGGVGGRRVEVAPGATVDAAISGSQTFGAAGEVFTALDALASALEANDTAAVGDAFSVLEDVFAMANVNAVTIGTRLSTLTAAELLSEDLRFEMTVQKGSLEEIDLASELSNLAALQTSYQTVIETGRQLLQLTSASFLG